MRIPKSIEVELLKQRKKINEQSKLFNKNNSSSMSSMRTQTEILKAELEFWKIENDELLDVFLLEELPYALLQADNDFEWVRIPGGYYSLVTAMSFELDCQNEGWAAVSNNGEQEMLKIIASYRYFGLDSEADALVAVLKEYRTIEDFDSEEFLDKIRLAYRSVENNTPELEDRLAVVRRFVRENYKLFAVAE